MIFRAVEMIADETGRIIDEGKKCNLLPLSPII
jgi:hypothetical protein